MTTYRVSKDGSLGVSLKGKVYQPGDGLPEDLSEEAAEQLLKTGAIEKAPAKAKTEAEVSDDTKAKAEEAAKAKAEADAKAKADAEAKAKSTGTNKPSTR